MVLLRFLFTTDRRDKTAQTRLLTRRHNDLNSTMGKSCRINTRLTHYPVGRHTGQHTTTEHQRHVSVNMVLIRNYVKKEWNPGGKDKSSEK